MREFERLAGLGYRAVGDGDHAEGARLLGASLALWRGAPFADVQLGKQLEMEAARLEESCARWTSASRPICGWGGTASCSPN